MNSTTIEFTHQVTGEKMVFWGPHGKMRSLEKYELRVSRIIELSEAYLFVDIGAGFGIHTATAALSHESVIAFEPHPIRYGFLLWNTRLYDNVQCKCESIGNASLPRIADRMAGPIRKNTMTTKPAKLNLWPPDTLVKIDVEGCEINVIEHLQLVQPNFNKMQFIIELHKGMLREMGCPITTVYDFSRLMPNHDYNVLDYNDNFARLHYYPK